MLATICWFRCGIGLCFDLVLSTSLHVALCKKASNSHTPTPGNVQFYIVTTWETPENHWCWWPDTLIIARALARCFPGGYNVKLYISRGRLVWWLLAFLCCVVTYCVCRIQLQYNFMNFCMFRHSAFLSGNAQNGRMPWRGVHLHRLTQLYVNCLTVGGNCCTPRTMVLMNIVSADTNHLFNSLLCGDMYSIWGHSRITEVIQKLGPVQDSLSFWLPDNGRNRWIWNGLPWANLWIWRIYEDNEETAMPIGDLVVEGFYLDTGIGFGTICWGIYAVKNSTCRIWCRH